MNKCAKNAKDMLRLVPESRIKVRLRKEKDSKVKTRLLACLNVKKGKGIPETARILAEPYRTVYRWIVAVSKNGLDAVRSKKNPGRPPKLDKKQQQQLYDKICKGPQKCGMDRSTWTAELIRDLVYKMFGIRYRLRGAQQMLHDIGFTCKMPRSRHPKAASAKEQKAFKRWARITAKRYAKKGWTVFTGDESCVIMGWNIHRGWYPKGEQATVPTSLSRRRTYIFALLRNGELLFQYYDKANKESFEDFLEYALGSYPKRKLLILLDNASYHRAKNIRKFEKKHRHKLKLLFYPPYTPELNSIEHQWSLVKSAIGNTLYSTTRKLRNAITRMIMNAEIKIALLSEYLCV